MHLMQPLGVSSALAAQDVEALSAELEAEEVEDAGSPPGAPVVALTGEELAERVDLVIELLRPDGDLAVRETARGVTPRSSTSASRLQGSRGP